MTEPVSYNPKQLGSIQAILYDGQPTTNAAIEDWVLPLLSPVAAVYPGGYGTSIAIVDGNFVVSVDRGKYLVYDGEKFHSVDKGALDLMFEVSGGS